MPLDKEAARSAQAQMRELSMFRNCSRESLRRLTGSMKPHSYAWNERIVAQGQTATELHLVADGEVARFHVADDGVEHQLDQGSFSNTINSLHVLNADPAYASARCVADSCTVYTLARTEFLKHLQTSPSMPHEIITGLCTELQELTRRPRTPLLQQHSRELNIPAVTIAAVIESYYRSALNAMLNRRLTGHTAELFPNMHIQVPTRVLYINGFKIMRSFIEKNIRPDEYQYPGLIQFASVIAPGILMTPISGVLEATNAGHQNSEPMKSRWMRGSLPRGVREIIFGIGLNQMSDFFEERMSEVIQSQALATAGGSLTAGVIAGYLSHVPHNLSTFKLLYPNKTYKELYTMFVEKSLPVGFGTGPATSFSQQVQRVLCATLFPRGVMIRTTQIVGSFMILNGTISVIQAYDGNRLRRAMEFNEVR